MTMPLDDGPWEDIVDSQTRVTPSLEEDSNQEYSESNHGGSNGSRRSASGPRRRRAVRTIFVASPGARNQPPALAVTRPPRPPRVAISQDDVVEVLSDGTAFAFSYARDVLSSSIRLLRRPLSFVIFLWLLAIILGRVSSTLRAAFYPFCYVPGISRSAFCSPPKFDSRENPVPRWADYPQLINVQSATFEQLLEESLGGRSLSLEIKNAEMATSDLVTLVRVSDLRSRDSLAESLAGFVKDAKNTGRRLSKLSSKVGGTVDQILGINDYALHTIQSAVENAPSPYSPRGLIHWVSGSPTNGLVVEMFADSMNVLSKGMRELIIEAELSINDLNNLEESLSVIHELVSREDGSISSAHAELLADLWTKLGGNGRKIRGYENHLVLLKNLSIYRKKALLHVVTALQTLQGMSDDMEDLRERVAAPELAGGRIPVEVHMLSIRSGLERLKEGRIKAREREEQAIQRMLSLDSD